MDQPITNGLTITLPARGETDWDENIKTYCFIPISSHNHEGNGSGNKLSNNALYNTTEHGAGNEAVDTNVIRDLAITRAKLAASLEADIAALEGLDANLVAFTGYQAPADYDPAVEGTLLFRIETAEGIIENRAVSLGTAIAADGTYAGHSGSNYIDGNSSLTEDLTDLDTQVKTNEDNISSNLQSITTLQSSSGTQSSDITTLQSDVTSLQNRALSSLSDVSSALPSNGQALAWNDDLSAWQPQTISGGSGGGVAENSFVGIVTEWQEYTPTLSGFSVNNQKAMYRRVGDSIQIIYEGKISSVTGTMEISLPTGLSIDQSKLYSWSTYSKVGTASAYDYPSGYHAGILVAESSNNKLLIYGDDGTLSWNASHPFNWANNEVISIISSSIPILGWDAVGLIDQSGSVDVVLNVKTTTSPAPQHTNSGNWQTVPFGIVEHDTVGGWDASTNQYTIPETGYYDITGAVRTGTSSGAGLIAISIDGSLSYPTQDADVTTYTNTAQGFDITFTAKYLQKGQTVELQFFQSTGGNLSYGQTGCYFHLAKRNSSQAIISGVGSDINYISNAKAVVNLAGWNEYDGTSATPSGTISGTASLTFERSEANPLRGSADFKLTTTSASLGEGVAYDFSVQRADLAKKMLIEFEYDASHSGYEDGDVKVFVYDVANSNLIRVNGEDLKGGKGTHFAQFQTSANGSDYRLLFHVTSANVYSIYLDDIKVSPIGVNDSVSSKEVFSHYTGVVTTNNDNVYLSGSSKVVKYKNVLDDTTNSYDSSTGIYTVPETGIYTINSSVLMDRNSGFATDSSSSNPPDEYFLLALYVDGVQKFVEDRDNEIATSQERYIHPTLTHTLRLSKGQELEIRVLQNSDIDQSIIDSGVYANLSILKSPSLALPESVGSGRDIICTINGLTSNESFAAGSDYKITRWNTPDVDTVAGWDSVNNKYVVPETGYYDINFGLTVTGDSNLDMWRILAFISLDGVPIRTGSHQDGNATFLPDTGISAVCNVSAIGYYIEAGSEITFMARQDNGNNETNDVYGSGTNTHRTYIDIAKRQSAQTVLDTETVAAKVKLTAAYTQSLPDNNFKTIQFNTAEFDTHGCFDLATNSLIAPVTGYYQVSGNILISQVTNTSQDANINWHILKTSSIGDTPELICWQSEINYYESSNTYIRDGASTTIYMEKGDSIKLQINDYTSDADSSIYINEYSFLTFARIK